MANTPTIYVALLRGINVGGKMAVKMTELKACLEQLGYSQIHTYGNSGNVIFTAAATDRSQLEASLEEALATRLAMPIGVFIRSLADMTEVVNGIPGDWQPGSERKYDIIFLRQRIDHPTLIDELRPNPAIEDLRYQPGVLFWSIHLRDFSKSHLSKLVGTALYQDMTIRGPSTIRKVYHLMRTIHGSS